MILVRIALRNLRVHRFKTAIVGSILLLGTTLVVVGGALLDAVDEGMKTSLIHSVTAHLQLYSAQAKDKFQIFGNMDGSMPDSGRIDDFSRVKKALEGIPNVKSVVPMGIDFAISTADNILQRKLAELRDAVRHNQREQVQILKRHVRRIVRVLDAELKNAGGLIDVKAWKKAYGDYNQKLARSRDEAFWRGFEADPYPALEYLENEVGPLALAEDMIFVRYLGTDTELFAKTFDRFEIVDGTKIPAGKRGFLFNKEVYERMVKNKTAYRLDQIKEKRQQGQTIATCDDCRTWIGFNERQAASLVFQFDERAAARVAPVLAKELARAVSADQLVPAMQAFMKMDDSNFERRYRLFYQQIVPHLMLYAVPIGSEFVLTAFSRRGGYARRVPLKVYGTFRFRSLDKSPLAGGFNLVDIVSFRDLYGYMTDERRKEQVAIRKAAGIKDVKREDADAMFGQGALVDAAPAKAFDATGGIDLRSGGKRFSAKLFEKLYSEQERHQGVALNVAVMLKDGRHLAASKQAIAAALKQAGLELTIIDWREASGLVGQLIGVIRIVLYSAVLVIFFVAMIIINNSLLMSTMERTPEIGTMRAIGAQRGFVMRMFLIETAVLALIFGGAGALLGSGAILAMGSVGIPAASDFFYFLFAGPRLHPALRPEHLAVAFIAVSFVALVSTLYPARLATKITPREAMSREE